ncbi:MAG TPA: phosphoenolpyruvate carboxykinase, partial [Hyalangium sp.]|nr:phosphoenolpyruvate carboxykinase [Hyalangium sp.]
MASTQMTAASNAPTKNQALLQWVAQSARMTQPDRIVWCDGSEEEKARLTDQAVKEGILIPLNQQKRPGGYLHRSNPNDVARVEHLTFICTPNKTDAGPTNNWMDPEEAYTKLGQLFEGSMKGRTMYVVPYVMGPLGSP